MARTQALYRQRLAFPIKHEVSLPLVSVEVHHQSSVHASNLTFSLTPNPVAFAGFREMADRHLLHGT